MRVLIFHQMGRKAAVIARRLRMENIRSEAFTLDGQEISLYDLGDKLLEVSACIFYINSANAKPPIELINKISNRYSFPILVLDEYDHPETKKLVLKRGGDMYFSTPFSFPDLAMKLKFLMYKNRFINGEKYLKFSDLHLDFVNHEVKRKTRRIFLRNKEFALLEFLMLNQRKVLSRNMILEHVWDRNGTLTSNTVDVHMARLRRKVDHRFKRKLIHTVHCVGYKLDTRP